MNKTLAIKFQSGLWHIVTITVEGDVIPLNLDALFPHSLTSIRFKGLSKNGRLLYHETDLKRTSPYIAPKD